MKKSLKTSLILLLCVLMLPIMSIKNVRGLSQKEFDKAMENAVVLYLNKSNVLVNGKKSYISEDRVVMPYEAEGTVYFPIEFFAKSILGNVSFEADKATVTVGDRSVDVDCVLGVGGAYYAKANELCEAFSYNLYVDKNGIIAYSKSDLTKVFDWNNNLHLLREKLAEFLYDDVSGEELYALLIENNPNNAHPRLLITDEKMAAIRAEVALDGGDEVYKLLYNKIINNAKSYLNKKPSKYEIRDGIRLLYVSWEAQDVIMACSLAYNLTLEEKYAERAYKEMAAVCAFPDWNPKHYLDVGVMSASVALGYDWIYNYMTPEQRAEIRAGIEKHVIPTVLEDINGCVGKRTYQWLKDGNVNNWRCVCAGGVGVAMLSMIDEFEGEALENAKYILPKMLEALRPEMMLWAPYGAYQEGIGYWEFAMQNFTYFIKSLEMTTGSDYGYVDLPGMNLTNEYFVATNGPVQIFNYHTAGAKMKSFYPATLMYLADKFDNPETTAPVLERILASADVAYGTFDDILYYEPVMSECAKSTASSDYYFPVSEVATMRTNTTKNALYVGLHCDKPYGVGGSGSDHMDAGQFQIQAKGEVWFLDLGSNDYNVSDLNNTYRFRAEGHNTVIFNPDYDYAMKKHGNVYISDFVAGDEVSYAIGEMTDAYNKEEGVTSFKRGIKLDKVNSTVTVQDEIELKKDAEIYWFAHTDAEISLSSDKKTATLKKNGKNFFVRIVNGEGAKFSVMDAKPLSSSPQVPDQEPVDSSVKKLTIHLEKSGSIDLCVVFAERNVSLKSYEYSSISEWSQGKIDDTDKGNKTEVEVTTDTTTLAATQTGSKNTKRTIIVATCVGTLCAAVCIMAAVIRKKKKKTFKLE